jgi:hypothetical protein
VGYVIASLALSLAAAGVTWSIDTKLRPALGKLGWPNFPSPAELPVTGS